MEQLANVNDFEEYATCRESHYFDRKSSRIKVSDAAQHVVAFANASGGKLVIGIEDDGRITGFKQQQSKTVENYEQIAITMCNPSPVIHCCRVPVINDRGDDDMILVIDVCPLDNRVVHRRTDDAVFLRQGDKSPRLNPEQIRALEYDKGQVYYENELELDSSIDDIDTDLLKRYKNSLGTDSSDEKVLTARGFLRNGYLTRAGVLLFSKNPSSFYPWARVRVLKVDGAKLESGKRLNIVKDKTFDGPIPEVIEGAKNMISTLLREFQYLGSDGKFGVIPEYPEFAWFEGLVNAVTHRDYSFSGDYIRVTLYDDRMEIFSPGKLPNIVTLDNMRETRFSRNPNIARTLIEFGWVRELNEGVQRIYDEMQSYFLNDPVFTEPEDAAVLLTLQNSATSRVLRTRDSIEARLSTEIFDGLNEYEMAAVQYAFSRQRVTTKQLASLIGRSGRTATTTLKGLEKKGIMVWHGTNQNDPSQYYTLSISE